MRFVSLVRSVVAKARQSVAQPSFILADVKDPAELVETIRGLTLRVNKLEAAAIPEGTEFEAQVGTGGATVSLQHNFKSAVRWYVVAWLGLTGSTYPVSAPRLVQDSTSTSTNLVLRSYTPGRAVIRVEPSQAYLDMGTDVLASPDNVRLGLIGNFTTTSTAATSTGLAFPVQANETWFILFQGGAGNSAAGATGMKFAIGAPTGSVCDVWHYSSTTNTSAANLLVQQIAAVNTLEGTAVHTVVGGERPDQIVGVVKTGANAGTISIQVAGITAATTTTVFANAALWADKIVGV